MALDNVMHRTRTYQQEMLDRSIEGNRIVVMDTGSGKTQVAILRILVELDRCPQEKYVWFLAPAVDLCFQQYNVLSAAMPAYKMRILTGRDNVDKWSDQRLWDAALDGARVVISTPAVLADALKHAFVRISTIALLVFDEAHHCIKKHPTNIIMRDFYHPAKSKAEQVPHILGLSASLIMSSNLKSLTTIENNLDSISVTPRMHREDLLRFVHRPECRLLKFSTQNPETTRRSIYLVELNQLIRSYEAQCRMQGWVFDEHTVNKSKDYIEAQILHQTLIKFRTKACHIEVELGIWAVEFFIAQTISCLNTKRTDLLGIRLDFPDTVQKAFTSLLVQTSARLGKYTSIQPTFDTISDKVKCLLEYLLESQPGDLRGIVFVEQRVVASVLSELLRRMQELDTQIRCMPYVGTSNFAGRKFGITELLDLRAQKHTLADFRNGDLNLVVATSVLEEGIDIQACNVVVCFDGPKNLKSFIQRRGRARHIQSRLGILIPSDGDMSAMEKFKALETELIAICQSDRVRREHALWLESIDEDVNLVLTSVAGAKLNADATLAHLYHFCATLLHSNDVEAKPEFTYKEELGLISATVTLPPAVSLQLRQTTSKKRWKTEKAAKKDAAFHAYAALKEAGLVNDNLLPLTHDWHFDDVADEQAAEAQIIPQHDIWTGEQGDWKELQAEIKIPDALCEADLHMMTIRLITQQHLLCPPDLELHWDAKKAYNLSFKSITRLQDVTVDDKTSWAATTTAIYRAPRSMKHWRDVDSTVYFVPAIHNTTSLCSSSTVSAASMFGTTITSLIRIPVDNRPAYLFRGWSEDEDGQHVLCEPLSRRRNFFTTVAPTIEKVATSEKRMKTFLAKDCTIDNVSIPLARLGLFMPAILQHIGDYTTTRSMMSEVFSGFPINNHEHFLSALCAPSAQRPVNYQRHEFIGDSILKFATSIYLFDVRPDWPVGYLSKRKDSLIRNSTLTQAALWLGLDRYIITEPTDFRDWSLPVFDASKNKSRQVRSKVLADVVEALIGAFWLDSGISTTMHCMRLIFPKISLDTHLHESYFRKVTFTRREEVESLIGYTFNHPALLLEALMNASSSHSTKCNSYQRLEFLGDAVLDMIVTEWLAEHITTLSQGKMTKIKAALVNGKLLGFLCFNLRHKETHRAVVEEGGIVQETVELRETPLAAYMYFSSDDISTSHQRCELRYVRDRKAVIDKLSDGLHYPWTELSHVSINKLFSDIVEAILGAMFLDAGKDTQACQHFLELLGLKPYARRILADSIEVSHPRARLQQKVGPRKLDISGWRDPIELDYRCCVKVDDILVTEVEGCVTEEDAEVLAASRAEEQL